MKNLIILFILASLTSKSQTNAKVYIWRVTPTVVCQGDWVKIDFKYDYPSPITYTVNTSKFYVNPPLTMIHQDNSVNFPSYQQESWPGSSGNCYYFWVQLPTNLSQGTHSITAGGIDIDNVINVSICTSIEEQAPQTNEEIIYFDVYGNKIEPRKSELMIQQNGNRRKKVVIQ